MILSLNRRGWLAANVWNSVVLCGTSLWGRISILSSGISKLQVWKRMPCFSKQTGEKQNCSLFLHAFVSVRLFGCSVFNLPVQPAWGWARTQSVWQ